MCYACPVDRILLIFGIALTAFGCIAVFQNWAIAAHGIRDMFRPPEQRKFVSFVPFVGGLSVFFGMKLLGCADVGALGFLIDPSCIPQFVCALLRCFYIGVRFLFKSLARLIVTKK